MRFNRRFGIYQYNESGIKESGTILVSVTGAEVLAIGRRGSSAVFDIKPTVQANNVRLRNLDKLTMQAAAELSATSLRQAGGSSLLAASSSMFAEAFVFHWAIKADPSTDWNTVAPQGDIWTPVLLNTTQWRKVF